MKLKTSPVHQIAPPNSPITCQKGRADRYRENRTRSEPEIGRAIRIVFITSADNAVPIEKTNATA
jgi:hypothetical protein